MMAEECCSVEKANKVEENYAHINELFYVIEGLEVFVDNLEGVKGEDCANEADREHTFYEVWSDIADKIYCASNRIDKICDKLDRIIFHTNLGEVELKAEKQVKKKTAVNYLEDVHLSMSVLNCSIDHLDDMCVKISRTSCLVPEEDIKKELEEECPESKKVPEPSFTDIWNFLSSKIGENIKSISRAKDILKENIYG